MQTSNKPYILFVDDEEMTRKTFQRIAGKEFEVLTAESVPSAKALLDVHAEDIGVLLSDQRMPGQLGVELLEYCRDAYPWIVRMLTTAYSDLADAIAAVNRGEIIRYIEKPWNNIDALLIDLRVAMRFHMLERENNKLLEEKLNAGAAISRLDRVRSLISIAATQVGKNHRLSAVEQMLRELSYLDCIQHSITASNLAELEMFGQPVSDTVAAIAVADALSIFSGAASGENWDDVFSVVKRAGCKLDIDFSSPLAAEHVGDLAAIVSGALAALSGNNPENLSVGLGDNGTGGWQMFFENAGDDNSYVGDWLSGLTIDEASLAMAGLLQLYLSATELGAKVSLSLDGNVIKTVEVTLVDEGLSNSANAAAERGWIDDILLLYS